MKRKLAVILKDKECPFGLSIPMACKSCGDTVQRMAPIDVLGDEAEKEEVVALINANRKLCMLEADGQRCPFAGKIMEENDAVECNFDSATPGEGSYNLEPSKYYTRVYDQTSYDGLFSYPMGWYGDNNISRNTYYGIYSLQGNTENNIEKVAATEEISVDDIKIYSKGLRDESFRHLEPIFSNSPGEYPKELKPIELITYPDHPGEIFVQDGRHRLLLSKKYKLDKIPAKLIEMDEGGWTKEKDVIVNFSIKKQAFLKLSQKDRFDYLRREIADIKRVSKVPDVFEGIDKLLDRVLSIGWDKTTMIWKEQEIDLVLKELYELRKFLMMAEEYDLANKVHKLYTELSWVKREFSERRIWERSLKTKPKQEFSALGKYLYHATDNIEEAYSMLKSRAIYRLSSSFSNVSFTSDIRSTGKFGAIVFVFDAGKLQRRGVKKVKYLSDEDVVNRGFAGTETYEREKPVYISEIYRYELEWALPLPFEFKDSLVKILVIISDPEEEQEAQQIKEKLEKASYVPIEIEYYPAYGTHAPHYQKVKEDPENLSEMVKLVAPVINKLLLKLNKDQRSLQTTYKQKYGDNWRDYIDNNDTMKDIRYLKTNISEMFSGDWYKDYDKVILHLQFIVARLWKTEFYSDFAEPINKIIRDLKTYYVSTKYKDDKSYLDALGGGYFGKVKNEILQWAVANIDKVVENYNKYEHFDGWYELIPILPDPFVLPESVLIRYINDLIRSKTIPEDRRSDLNYVLREAEKEGRLYGLEHMEMPEMADDDIWVIHVKDLISNDNNARLGKERLKTIFHFAKERVLTPEETEEINNHLNKYDQDNPATPLFKAASSTDIKDAVQHAILQEDSTFTGKACYKIIEQKEISLKEILNWDDYSSWGDFSLGELKDLNEEEFTKELNSFRPGFGDLVKKWKNIPPIILVDTLEAGSMIGDGRGRVNLAVGLGLARLPVIVVKEDPDGDICFNFVNGIMQHN
jgi:hypothetical protein